MDPTKDWYMEHTDNGQKQFEKDKRLEHPLNKRKQVNGP